MSSQGPNLPTDTRSVSWSDIHNIEADDGVYASASFPSHGTITQLVSAAHGFTIPNAVINGIEVRIKFHADTANALTINQIVLEKNTGGGVAGASGSPKADVTPWSTSDEERVYGGPSDLWGASWLYTDINDALFGCSLNSVTNLLGSTVVGFVDYMKITVYYGTPIVIIEEKYDTEAFATTKESRTVTVYS